MAIFCKDVFSSLRFTVCAMVSETNQFLSQHVCTSGVSYPTQHSCLMGELFIINIRVSERFLVE